MKSTIPRIALPLLVLTLTSLPATAAAGSFYRNPEGLFSTRPDDTKSLNTIGRLGPVGMGIELIQPAFTMRIKNIEEGSPAAATGKLKPGQIIELINGEKLKKEGHRYRLVVGGLSHVNNGDGFRIYINGKLLMERERGVGKREGDQPICYWIEKAWWPDFQSGKTTVAATSFLRIHFRSKVKGNHFSVWLQEMKVPPLGDREILNSATVVPMLSSAWQAKQDPDDAEIDPDADRFLWDGEFVPNAKVLGQWQTIALVPAIDAFDPDKPVDAHRAPLNELTILDRGRTHDQFWIWSGDTLMDLDRNQALKMIVKTINGTDHLFVEAGGFNPNHPADWQSPWCVMTQNP